MKEYDKTNHKIIKKLGYMVSKITSLVDDLKKQVNVPCYSYIFSRTINFYLGLKKGQLVNIIKLIKEC